MTLFGGIEFSGLVGSPKQKYMADFYENLYQAREGQPQYKKWTDLIK